MGSEVGTYVEACTAASARSSRCCVGTRGERPRACCTEPRARRGLACPSPRACSRPAGRLGSSGRGGPTRRCRDRGRATGRASAGAQAGAPCAGSLTTTRAAKQCHERALWAAEARLWPSCGADQPRRAGVLPSKASQARSRRRHTSSVSRSFANSRRSRLSTSSVSCGASCALARSRVDSRSVP